MDVVRQDEKEAVIMLVTFAGTLLLDLRM